MWSCNRFMVCTAIAAWTAIQTLFHLVWVVIGYSFYMCYLKPSEHNFVLTYITYFYRNKCGPIILDNYGYFISNDNMSKAANDNSSSVLYNFLRDILENAQFPDEALQTERTITYLTIFIPTDIVWILTALLLLLANCYQVKKRMAILFYGPWLVLTGYVTLLDVVAAVHYGLDLRYITNYSSWLKFVGVENYKSFTAYDELDGYKQLLSPTALICALSSRLFIFWIANGISFFYIMNSMMLSFQDKFAAENNIMQPRRFATSEARIRNWQLFYGTTQSNYSAHSNLSNNNLQIQSSSTVNSDKAVPMNSSSYHQYSDVVEPSNTSFMGEILHQFPFSYEHGSNGHRRNSKLVSDGLTSF